MGNLWAIGGGKGGVGKTFLTACMGIALARSGKSVILADVNFAAPDLHGFLGARSPGMALKEVLDGGAPLSEALLSTSESHLHLLNCTGDELVTADLPAGQCMQIARCIRELDADCILLDAGTGSAGSVLDFFNLADQPIVVSSPDPASMRCTYRFLRNAIFRRVQNLFGAEEQVENAIRSMNFNAGDAKSHTMADFLEFLNASAPELAGPIGEAVRTWRPTLVINLAVSDQDHRIGEILQSAVRKFLGFDLQFGGLVPLDSKARRSIPRALDFGPETDSPAARRIRDLAYQLAGNGADGAPGKAASAAAAPGLNSNVVLLGRNVHIQTEDQGIAAHSVLTQVFCEGRVLLSTKSEYAAELRDPGAGVRLLDLMRAQHLKVIRQLEDRNNRAQLTLVHNS